MHDDALDLLIVDRPETPTPDAVRLACSLEQQASRLPGVFLKLVTGTATISLTIDSLSPAAVCYSFMVRGIRARATQGGVRVCLASSHTPADVERLATAIGEIAAAANRRPPRPSAA